MAIQPQILLTVGKSHENKLRLVNVDENKYPPFEKILDGYVDIDQSHPHWWNYFLCGIKGKKLIYVYIWCLIGVYLVMIKFFREKKNPSYIFFTC